MDRLELAKCLLDSATQAVQLKRMLLKDQLRNAVVKAVHVKQYAETEAELAEAVAGLIKRQWADAGRKLGRTKDESELIEKGDLPGHPFRGNQWSGGQRGSSDIEVNVPKEAVDYVHDMVGDERQLPGLVGAQSKSKLKVDQYGVMKNDDVDGMWKKGEKYFSVQVEHEKYTAEYVVFSDRIAIVDMHVKERGSGLGTKIFTEQTLAAGEAGFDSIEMNAVGSRGDTYNGYYTWPRLGCDGPLSSDMRTKARNDFPEATRISDLMKTPEGRSWWKENGESQKVSFDLRDGSLSRRVLDAYTREKSSSKSAGPGRIGRGDLGRDLGQDRTATKSPSARDIFDPRDWDGDLIDTCLPVLMKKAGEAAAAQMLLMGVDVAPRGKRTKGTKASRATDWLLVLEDEGEDLSPLWPEVFSLPGGGAVDLAFATEWPAWMKAEISKQMKETFSQPFWAGINDTTAQGIRNYVEKGLLEGWSIREIQQEMVGDGLDEFYHNRGQNIARTESGNALNGARSAAMDRLQEEVPGLKVKRTWMSVLGTTTRDSHASLDGVPADSDGLWYLGGVRVPWPGHWNLPVGERVNCQCTLIQSWGQSDEAAEELIADYNERLNEERAARDFWTKGDYAGHPFRGNQWSGGGGSSVREHAAEMISRLDAMFRGPGRAAAVNEVLTAVEYPEYLKGILKETPGVDEIEAVVEWSVRRGRIWEAA